ncbi:MAG: gfo/Idh/MocA family oxidoreductase, partial [Spirosomataceae bacterium]
YGENGSLEWHQMEPNTLMHRIQNDFSRVIRPGVGKLSESANAHIRVPAGHPEGYFEAFANIYRNFARTVRKKMNGQEPTTIDLDFPTIDEGIRGMLFVEKVLESSKSDKKWIKMEE